MTAFTVAGKDCRLQLETLRGTHRVQRVPTTDKEGRKHTSTATIAVLDVDRKIEVQLKDSDLKIDRMRGRGKGGQRRNKVETAVRVIHVPSGVVVTRLSGRSQSANIEDAKRAILEELETRKRSSVNSAVATSRRSQTNSERSGKDFTHCWYRDDVVRHSDGRRWTVKQWKQGRL